MRRRWGVFVDFHFSDGRIQRQPDIEGRYWTYRGARSAADGLNSRYMLMHGGKPTGFVRWIVEPV